MGLFTDGFKLLKKASEPLYKTPKSIQETIEIMAVAENGIFEVSRNKYSKCYRFQDINYTTATEDEQIGIFERYCKFLNSLDCNYKITINNKNKNMEDLRDKVLITEKNDGSTEISYAKRTEKKEIEAIMDDVRENDQCLFFVGVTIILMAESKKELESVCETVETIGKRNSCTIDTHYLKQREALNTALPIGVRQVETMRTLLTQSLAVLEYQD